MRGMNLRRIKSSLFHQFILLSVVICCIVAISFCTMLLYVRRYSLRSSSQVLDNLHTQTTLRIEEYYTAIENGAYTICYSPTLQEYIQTDNLESRIDLFTNIKSLHSGLYLSLESLIGIAAYDMDGVYLNSTMENFFSTETLPEEWSDVTGYCYTDLNVPGNSLGITRNNFALLAPVYELLPNTRLLGSLMGTLVLTFNTEHLTSIIKSNNPSANTHLILTDADGKLICASSNAAISYYENRTWEQKSPVSSIESTFSKSGWRLYSFMPQSFLREEVKPLLLIVSVTGCIFLLLLFLLLLMLRQKVLRPISQLSGFMEKVPMDEQPSRFETNANNELGAMIHMMNRMLEEIELKNEHLRNSEAKLFATELSRKDMEILAYRNQINPHFLYNTLDCICSIAMYHGADDVAEISESLSTMFRYAVKGGSFATISQEVNYVQEYASIISHRFRNRITIHVDAAPETLSLQTIKLLIQPLVENAVFHGLERQVGSGNVYIKISFQADENLVISVYDDGIGIQDEKLESLKEGILAAQAEVLTVPSTEKSIGLCNIARRIHLYYGDKGIIRIHSTEGTGTVVTIILPLLEGGSACTKS